MSKYKYTLEQMQDAIANSISISECLTKLGLNASGNAYKVFKRYVETYNLDTSHFLGKGYLKGQKGLSINKIPLIEILEGHHPYYGSHKLKLRLFNDGYFEKKCYCCGLTEWMGQDIPLELEHKDGNNENHHLDNLTILCPNCHAQTPTHAGKNKKRV